ncbi:MAG: hypothetical protein HC867_00625 [Bacteroidia bacterium]|nr:hypothetical protein [Bacteroidia bacterium]
MSTPFVYNSGLQKEKIASTFPDEFPGDIEDLPENPFTNSTEEKTESGTNSFSEYLHDAEEIFHSAKDRILFNKQFSASLYIAFHGELLSPPPEMF